MSDAPCSMSSDSAAEKSSRDQAISLNAHPPRNFARGDNPDRRSWSVDEQKPQSGFFSVTPDETHQLCDP